jgi:hypothetical protein
MARGSIDHKQGGMKGVFNFAPCVLLRSFVFFHDAVNFHRDVASHFLGFSVVIASSILPMSKARWPVLTWPYSFGSGRVSPFGGSLLFRPFQRLSQRAACALSATVRAASSAGAAGMKIIKGNQIDRCGDWRKKTAASMNGSGKGRDSLENHNCPPRGSDNTKSAPIS